MRPAGTAELPYRAITFVHVPPQGFEPCSTDQESATSPQCFGGLLRGEPRNRTRWGLHPWLLSTQLPSPCGRSPPGRAPCGTRTRCFALKGRPLNPSRYGTCVTQEGFEPPTLRISDGSSTRLSYCVKMPDVRPVARTRSQGWNRTNGHLGQNQAGDHHHSGLRRASGRSRTCDLLLFREALSRLSY